MCALHINFGYLTSVGLFLSGQVRLKMKYREIAQKIADIGVMMAIRTFAQQLSNNPWNQLLYAFILTAIYIVAKIKR
jgi:uncharacterized membrane protein (DUF485 family)